MRDGQSCYLLRCLQVLMHNLVVSLGGRHIHKTAMDAVAATVVVATQMLTIGGKA